ncbi:MAG: MarR family transcriptional regulator [Nitriliruptorales bacterium]|nr:MarR family transcriptional regulator [Nitriliruptorales bacterium]
MDVTTLPTELDQLHLRAWRRFLEAHAALIDVLETELRQHEDLPLSWYDVLVQLAEATDERLRMQELADAVLLSKSGLTRLVDRMESEGLVERQACKTDRRGTWAVLTRRGRDRLRDAAPAHLDGVARHFARHLSEAEAATLAEVLERVVESLDD